jgi:hypothetical protein
MFPVRYGLPPQCICVFRMVLTTNKDSFPIEHYLVGSCSGDVMGFLWGTDCPHTVSVCYAWFHNKQILFLIHHYPVWLCSGDVPCFLWGKKWICTLFIRDLVYSPPPLCRVVPIPPFHFCMPKELAKMEPSAGSINGDIDMRTSPPRFGEVPNLRE